MNANGEIQKIQIIKYLEANGEMTRQDAFFHLGIANPTARISEIRKVHRENGEYIGIGTRMESGLNQFGQPVRFAVWYPIIDLKGRK